MFVKFLPRHCILVINRRYIVSLGFCLVICLNEKNIHKYCLLLKDPIKRRVSKDSLYSVEKKEREMARHKRV